MLTKRIDWRGVTGAMLAAALLTGIAGCTPVTVQGSPRLRDLSRLQLNRTGRAAEW